MSENLNRDFSQYDLMETEELEKILRLDAEAPVGAESDTELLLYVMEVLARRRNHNHDIAGNNAHSAWSEFQEHYMPEVILDSPKKDKRRPALWLRRAVAAAAVLVLVFVIPVTAKALTIEEIWDIVARWAKETFSFVSGENTEVSEPTPDDLDSFSSLQELLIASNRNASLVPTWIPGKFKLSNLERDVTPIQEIYRANYSFENEVLKIRVQTHLSEDIQNNEIENEPIEIYVSDGIEYYIFKNLDQLRAIWTVESYECLITGDVTLDEIKMMIDSIEKG